MVILVIIHNHNDYVNKSFLFNNLFVTMNFILYVLVVMESKLASLTKSQFDRMKFIDFRILFLGEIKRNDLAERFGIASAATTRDFALYKEVSFNGITLDQKSKSYIPNETFKPVFEHDVSQALKTLTQGLEEITKNEVPQVMAEFPRVLSLPSLEILATISRTIFKKQSTKIIYHSMSSGRREREVVPFALINNGQRWHMRAFDRLSNEFRDFVLTRIESAQIQENSKMLIHESPQNDISWSRIVELEIVPHPNKIEKEANIIKMDYEMLQGVLTIRVRAAIVGYLLRQWFVDCTPDHSIIGEEFRLWLRNNPILYGIENAKLAPGYGR